MKAFGKLLGELVAWRWAPAVGLCVASLFYVLVVVALVPDEIGVPVTNARFAKKAAPTSTTELPEAPTFPTAMTESEMPPPQPAPVRTAGVVDFGRRGFSPPIDRPEPPPPPVVAAPPPVPPPPVAVAPPVPAPPPAVTEAPPVEGAQATTSEPVAQAAPTAAPGGIFRALRSVLPGDRKSVV